MSTFAPRSLLVPLDFGQESLVALERAVELARTHQLGEITAVHIRGPDEPPKAERDWQSVETLVEHVQTRMGLEPTLRVRCLDHRASDVVEGILRVAKRTNAHYIATGTHGGGIMSSGVAEELLRRSEAHVLVLRGGADRRWPRKPVRTLVGVDFSENSRRALRAARELAGDGPMVAFLVAPVRDDGRLPFEVDPELPEKLREKVESWAATYASEACVAQGDPARMILDEAARESAGLIALGSKGLRDELGRWVLGRVPDRVIQGAGAPVLVVR